MTHTGKSTFRSRHTVIPQASWPWLAALLVAAASTALAQDRPDIQPEGDVQAVIQEVAEAVDRDRQQAALDRLSELAVASGERLARQLAWYAARSPEQRRSAVVGAILRRVDLADETIARALWPSLAAGDAAVVQAVRGLLMGLEHRSATRRPDLSVYFGIIEERVRSGAAHPSALIRYMYETDAGGALLVVMRAHQLRDPEAIKRILWAEHQVSNVLWKQQHGFLRSDEIEVSAAEQLRLLSSHEAWWSRLYVSEIMRKHSAFRAPEIIRSLAHDPDPLVRASAGEITSSTSDPARP